MRGCGEEWKRIVGGVEEEQGRRREGKPWRDPATYLYWDGFKRKCDASNR
jgi:hypothetical protein